jgi:hypothetical protein
VSVWQGKCMSLTLKVRSLPSTLFKADQRVGLDEPLEYARPHVQEVKQEDMQTSGLGCRGCCAERLEANCRMCGLAVIIAEGDLRAV